VFDVFNVFDDPRVNADLGLIGRFAPNPLACSLAHPSPEGNDAPLPPLVNAATSPPPADDEDVVTVRP
jgi:hypothetical protein